MVLKQFNTIQDLIDYWYGTGAEVAKADAPILTGTTGVFNPVYGKKVWLQLNQQRNIFGLLPKTPWNNSGIRVITDLGGSSADGGVSEAGTIPDSIKPTFTTFKLTPKTVAHIGEVSEVQRLLAEQGKDDAIGTIAQIQGWLALKHEKAINEQLLKDASAEAASATADRTSTDTLGFESVDRIVSNDSEEDTFGGTYANWFDPYLQIDRDDSTASATTWADSYVDHNSGTDRDLTEEMLITMYRTLLERGAQPTMWITGYDTLAKIETLFSTTTRYNPLGQSRVKITENGIETVEGFDTGITVSSLFGIPLFVDMNVAKDTISRVYLLDTSDPEGFGEPRLGLSILMPTMYFEAGLEKVSPFAIGKFSTKIGYVTIGEVACRNFRVQGKIRDLK